MKNVGIIPNILKDNDLAFTRKLINYLTEKDCNPVLQKEIADKMELSEYGLSDDDFFRKSEFVIVLGGDGTMLRAGAMSCKYNTPIVGINLGTVGFLIDVEVSSAFLAIEKILAGDYKIEKRIMLNSVMTLDGAEKECFTSLNDVCISKGTYSKIINLNVYVNDEYLATFRADGIIIATPTGSTAYNLSAGGPIVKPDAQNIVITPVCAHSFHARGIVVSGDDVIKIVADDTTRGEMFIYADGDMRANFKNNDILVVKKSQFYTNIIKTTEGSFYDTLRRKLVRNEG